MPQHSVPASVWPAIIQLLFGAGFAGLILLLAHKITPRMHKKAEAHPDTFECGIPYADDARGVFNVKFYLIAMVFIVFDVEAIFLMPWAVSFRSFKDAGMGLVMLIELTVFLAILFVGYYYVIKKGALTWEDPN
ncbi:MAG TPA: NADH-quinone oxidoreductase subunit A [Turneriella sp.]|nr:NADH-quinone oxidoreductase subunit A [Turneriella sp.]HMY10805.1 NADH-quinone oxidoreductase subunit A [Turneriella sp.]HNE21258.1 NADH-quinone oxidoreductase subunit A [Turneriella sp.]HNJ65974.1 NADH-quinone oxidoreductase subunit A [Turneriella sp.]HNL10496.1 NADH-quinone oxidoreductase subunit A [Turneriella sp.]